MSTRLPFIISKISCHTLRYILADTFSPNPIMWENYHPVDGLFPFNRWERAGGLVGICTDDTRRRHFCPSRHVNSLGSNRFFRWPVSWRMAPLLIGKSKYGGDFSLIFRRTASDNQTVITEVIHLLMMAKQNSVSGHYRALQTIKSKPIQRMLQAKGHRHHKRRHL